MQVVAATNRIDTLDPALLRSGRLDRKIEFPHPTEEARARILQIHSRKMNVHEGVNYEELGRSTDDFNGAQLKVMPLYHSPHHSPLHSPLIIPLFHSPFHSSLSLTSINLLYHSHFSLPSISHLCLAHAAVAAQTWVAAQTSRMRKSARMQSR